MYIGEAVNTEVNTIEPKQKAINETSYRAMNLSQILQTKSVLIDITGDGMSTSKARHSVV